MRSWTSGCALGLVVAGVFVGDGGTKRGTHLRDAGTQGSQAPGTTTSEASSAVGATARGTSPPSSASLRLSVVTVTAESRVGLVPSEDPKVTEALVEGMRRAFDEARAAGGPDLALVVGAASAQWSSAASEAVRLACEERVVALVAPPERTLAHPVAQAATRCGVPVVSTSGAASVTAAGSRFVLAVVPDGTEVAPRDAGYDAARVVVEAVRRAGLRRDAVLAAARDGTPVTGAAGSFRVGPSGRRESAGN